MPLPVFTKVYAAIAPLQQAFSNGTRSAASLQRDTRTLLNRHSSSFAIYRTEESGTAQHNFLASFCALLLRVFNEEDLKTFYDTNTELWDSFWLLPDLDTPTYYSEADLKTATPPLALSEPSFLVRNRNP